MPWPRGMWLAKSFDTRLLDLPCQNATINLKPRVEENHHVMTSSFQSRNAADFGDSNAKKRGTVSVASAKHPSQGLRGLLDKMAEKPRINISIQTTAKYNWRRSPSKFHPPSLPKILPVVTHVVNTPDVLARVKEFSTTPVSPANSPCA